MNVFIKYFSLNKKIKSIKILLKKNSSYDDTLIINNHLHTSKNISINKGEGKKKKHTPKPYMRNYLNLYIFMKYQSIYCSAKLI